MLNWGWESLPTLDSSLPSSSAGQPWSPRNPLPWPCQRPGRRVYSTGTWPFAQSALTAPGKVALQSGHLRDPPKHRPGITDGRGGQFLFHSFSFFVLELCCCARAFSVAVSRGYSSLRCVGFSVWWSLLLKSTGSRLGGFSTHRLSSFGSRALEHRLSSCGTRAL